MTDRYTCDGAIPMVRSSESSLVRWACSTLNVVNTTPQPTTKARSESAKRIAVSELERWARFESCALLYSARVITDVWSCGITALIRSRNVSMLTVCAATSIRSHRAPMPVTRCNHDTLANTALAPVRSPPVVGCTNPTMRAGRGVVTPTDRRRRSPTCKPAARAVEALTTTSPSAAGARPAVMTNGSRFFEAIQL